MLAIVLGFKQGLNFNKKKEILDRAITSMRWFPILSGDRVMLFSVSRMMPAKSLELRSYPPVALKWRGILCKVSAPF